MRNKLDSGEPATKKLRVAVKALITNDGMVLLVRRSALPESAYPLDYNLPGGAVEPGETLISALKREIAEETALEISVDGILGIREWIAQRHNAYYVGIFFACRSLSNSSPISLNYENSDYIWATAADMDRLKIIDSSRSVLEEFFSVHNPPLLPYMLS
jgi:8-oxo-dGTP diphosphatase